MARDMIFYLRLDQNEKDLLRAFAERMKITESAALRVALAAVANETLTPSNDVRGLVRKMLQPIIEVK